MSKAIQCHCGQVLHLADGAANFRCPKCRKWLMRDSSPVIYEGTYGPYQHFAPPTRPSTVAHWYKLHAYAMSAPVWQPLEAKTWLAKWGESIPVSANCKCREHWRQVLIDHPPRFSSRLAFFRWSVEVHNVVNALPNLRKPQLSYAQAARANGFGPRRDYGQQRPIESMVAVTSLSALPKHQEVQPRCLDSWRRFGLEIASVNTPEEIDRLRGAYPQVSRWIASRDQGTEYSWPTQRINALFRAVADKPFLMLNSDIELHGPQRRLLEVLHSGRVGVGLRYNYDAHWRDGKREGWGIDAFLVRPEQAAGLPDMPFAIGRPMWDYWLPYHFDTAGIAMEWIAEPLFFHQAHPVHWSQRDLDQGREWLREQYGDAEDWYHVRRRWPFHGG